MATAPNSGLSSRYYNNAMNQVTPFMNQALEQSKAGLVDQGLLSSTAGQGQLGQLRGQYYAQASQLADDRARQDRQFWEAKRQFNSQQAANTYELLMSGYLQRRQLAGSPVSGRPYQPKSFGTYQRFKGDPLEQRGDAGESWKSYAVDPDKGPDMAMRQFTAQQALAQQAAELEAERLKLQQDQFDYQKTINPTTGLPYGEEEPFDPDASWQIMASDAEQNRLLGLSTPGQNILPSAKLEQYQAAFLPKMGYQSWTEVLNSKDAARAESLIRSMYADPEIANRVIARLKMGDPGAMETFGKFGKFGGTGGAPETVTNSEPNFWANSRDNKLFGMSPLGADNKFFGVNLKSFFSR